MFKTEAGRLGNVVKIHNKYLNHIQSPLKQETMENKHLRRSADTIEGIVDGFIAYLAGL